MKKTFEIGLSMKKEIRISFGWWFGALIALDRPRRGDWGLSLLLPFVEIQLAHWEPINRG